ncbi:MAG: lysylphosphatidylglycerol synthase transmembrane domain-containing protein [Saprospiraceae bacterium]
MEESEEEDLLNQEDEQTRSVLKSFKSSKIWLPVFIGLGVVTYKLFQNFDPTALKSIQWSPHSLLWLLLAVIILLLRHLAYTIRLFHLSDKSIGFWRCVRLIVIWEFCSAISPSSLGGSAVSVFVLSQEKIGAPKTLAIIVYTVILDSLFFIISVPVMIVLFGVNVIYPTYHAVTDFSEIGYSLLFLYTIILSYGLFFAYGLFISPFQFKRILNLLTRLPFLKKWNTAANKLGDDIIVSAKELATKDLNFHLKSFGLTAAAWAGRFLLVNCLIIALIDNIPYDLIDQLKIFGRQIVMFIFMMFSPTPGAAGFAEFFFGNYIGDYVPKSAALIIALIWRMLTYYAYLMAGVIIIPTWLSGVIKRRREERQAKNSHLPG